MGKDGTLITVERTVLRIPFWPFAVATVSLPAVSLAVCFITAFIFRFDDVNETMCEVQNYIPSISAVTGITPQTYVWRIGIALHSAPRFAVGFIHYNYYIQRVGFVKESQHGLFRKLVCLNFWLNTIENASLVGVTYVTNRENYPVHEKIFVMFMVTSLCYMLCNIGCYRMSRELVWTKDEERSYFWKKWMFVSCLSATAGLIFYFIKHRLFCEAGAFSMFSACEYVIAYTNMAYHMSAYIDFKDKEWLVATPQCHSTANGTVSDNNNVRLSTSASTPMPNGTSSSRKKKH